MTRTAPPGELTIALSRSGDILLRRVLEFANTGRAPVGRPVIRKENTRIATVSRLRTPLVVILLALNFLNEEPVRRMSDRRNPSVTGALTVFIALLMNFDPIASEPARRSQYQYPCQRLCWIRFITLASRNEQRADRLSVRSDGT